MPDYFVDCHCHLFNIEDIPLYSTLAVVDGLPNSLLALGALFGKHKQFMNERGSFINFFERRRMESAEWISKQVSDAISKIPEIQNRHIIITPLVMDFDKIKKSSEKVEYQTSRLISEIKAAKPKDNITILPFVGFDLRKLKEMNNFDDFLKSAKATKLRQKTRSFDDLSSGDIVGVKLYPPIGFNPFSDNSDTDIDLKQKAFYKLCIERNIPITVHCQEGSYHGFDVDQDKVKKYTDPINWLKVLQSFKKADSDRLRINFAHFGGEDTIKSAVLPDTKHEDVLNNANFFYDPNRLNIPGPKKK